MSWGNGKVLPPAVTDPLVVDGTKYRIRSIVGEQVRARTSFGDSWTEARLSDLIWDKVASVWRVAA